MTTLASYLLTRLKQIGVDHLFAVPGDFVLGFLNQVLKSELRYVGTCNELNAAYAADGYARIHGIGAFATTFGVGELSALNGVAGAFAEGVPVVAITGTPASSGFRTRPLLHHTLGDYQIPLKMYELITVASAQLDNAERAPAEIDRVLLACLEHQLPVYLSLPSDLVDHPCPEPGPFPFPVPRPSDPDALREALEESVALISQAALPIVIADGELARFHLQDALAALIARTGLPFVTRMLGKAMLSEHLPQFIGLFEGDRSRAYVRDRVGSVTRPVRELKGFQKIALAAGEEREVAFTLTPADLAFWRADMTFGPEPGAFDVYVGDNADAALTAPFSLAAVK